MLAVLRGVYLFALKKIAVKMRYAVIARFIGRFANRHRIGQQQLAGLAYAQIINIINSCFAGHFLKKAAKSSFIHTGQPGQAGYLYILTKMVMNIITHLTKPRL